MIISSIASHPEALVNVRLKEARWLKEIYVHIISPLTQSGANIKHTVDVVRQADSVALPCAFFDVY